MAGVVVGRCSGRQAGVVAGWQAGVVAGWQAGVVAGWQAGVVAVTEDLVQRGWLTKIKYIFGGYIFTPKIKKKEILFVVMYNASINKAIKYQTCIN